MPARIVHIAYSAQGGAGRAALRASMACQKVGLNSIFASVRDGEAGAEAFTLQVEHAKAGVAGTVRNKLQWGLLPRTQHSGYSLFSTPYPGVEIDAHPSISAADILHLHWPSWTVTPPAIRRFLDSGRPVFITLHDMWMFTGGCHYAGECRQFCTGCMKCPQIADGLGLANAVFEDKLACYGGGHPSLHVVALCDWMADFARESRILGQSPIHLIPNPIETDLFVPGDRAAHRAELGIGPDDAVLLFGNFDNTETRKGADILRAALDLFAASPCVAAFPGRIFLLSFGRHSDMSAPAPLHPMSFGSVNDDALLARIYGVADMLCFPSLEDNYPNSIVEAAACGTPTIAFDTGGMSDMIQHEETGLLVSSLGDAAAFATTLERGLERLVGSDEIRKACRQWTVEENAPEVVGKRLATAYEAALDGASGNRAMPGCQTTGDGGTDTLGGKLLSQINLGEDCGFGQEFARFPVSQYLRDNGAQGLDGGIQKIRRYTPPGEERIKILTVRAFHEHHSAHSGPYQFLRHLQPDEFELSNMVVPLGDQFAAPNMGDKTAPIGRLLGVEPFGAHPNLWSAEWEIARRLQTEMFDLVHLIDGELSGWLISRLPDENFANGRRPALMTMLHQPPHLAASWTSAAALTRFDMLSAVAEVQAEQLRERSPGIPVEMAPHGVDIDFFHPGPVKKVAPKGRPLRLLAVGQWLRDYHLAFEVLDQLVAEGLAFEYRVICHSLDYGEPPAYVTMLSGLSDEELRDEYRAADLLFMPLSYATANNAVLESMACGTPVVSSAVGGVPEYVSNDAGRLCPPDADAFARALRELVSDTELMLRMGRSARRCAETFDWRNIAARYAEIYRSLVAGKRAEIDATKGMGVAAE